MTTRYRYMGIFLDRTPRDQPLGVVRLWTDADGEQREESFRASLTWEPSEVFSPMARPDNYEYAEVGEPIVEQFIERVGKLQSGA
jgi:hypothetical protein